MSKIAFLAFGAIAATSAVTAVYYVSPAAFDRQEGAPPLLVEATPETVMPKLRAIRMDSYFSHIANSREKIPDIVRWRLTAASKQQAQYDLFVGSDNPLRFVIDVKPAGGGKSEVEVNVLFPASRFRTNAALHPYEMDTLATMIDFAATDYVSSLVNAHRPMSDKELKVEFEKRFDHKSDQAESMGRRVGQAVDLSYKSEFENWVRREEAYREHQQEMVQHHSRAAYGASYDAYPQAAAQGAEAAANAADAAGRAADAAARAAEQGAAAAASPAFGEPTMRLPGN
jgi:hypothetical protein